MKKTTLITGASGGIGQAIARRLASQGDHLLLHYYQNKEAMEALAKELSLQTEVTILQADLAHENGADALLSQIHGPVDGIVHNSGDSFVGLLTDMSNAEVERMIRLHLYNPIVLTKALIPKMVQVKNGNIVFITSIWGLAGASCEVVYSTVKGGQNSFVKSLAKELAPSGVRVNAIAPGAILTPMMKDFSEEDLQSLAEEIPLGRLGQADEVANAVRFLMSDQSTYITGQILSVNGGWYV